MAMTLKAQLSKAQTESNQMTMPLFLLDKIILMKTDDIQQNHQTYELCDLRPNQAMDILLDPLFHPFFFHISLDDPLEQVKPLITSSSFEKKIQFKSNELDAKTINYEISTSIGLSTLSDDKLNAWMHDAYPRLHELAIALEINTEIQGSPILFIHGSILTSRAQIICLQLLLVELASTTSATLWVTEILNGDETIVNYTKLAQTHSLWRKISPEQN